MRCDSLLVAVSAMHWSGLTTYGPLWLVVRMQVCSALHGVTGQSTVRCLASGRVGPKAAAAAVCLAE
jgi:hypothetical protein